MNEINKYLDEEQLIMKLGENNCKTDHKFFSKVGGGDYIYTTVCTKMHRILTRRIKLAPR